ncbi:MAG: exodeoxyribonuclease V subunit gamma [Methylococcaceae bacterium]|nr:exodeoxyribonuclease V subunit gamma [Methylococcaceae bacterium]
MLHLYQSNRLEILVELLAAVIGHPIDQALKAQTVIVQSQGMGRWISLRLAEQHGICANIRFPLPASFLWQLLCEMEGELPRSSAFSPEVLAFRLMDWLASPSNLEQTPRLEAYLKAGDELRRFELASRIADVFDQYLVYRPDWIAAWERGETLGLGEDEKWQALLWRAMVAATDEPHRDHLLRRLLKTLEDGTLEGKLPGRLVLFGISALPPVFLEVIKALSHSVEVFLFALNPCREAWGEIRDPREIAKLAGEVASEDLYLETGNPLLASLGKQGREFFDALLAEQPEVHELFDENPLPCDLLHSLQADILDLVEPDEENRRTIAADDRSLQIHICHSPMREVEVLRDQLLAMLDADPELDPADIAVLTPDIAAYAPYIEAVFGAAESAMRIPYSIADRNRLDEQALLETFLRLLDLPSSRFEAAWVMDFLEQASVRARFSLVEGELPTLHHWVRESGIRWGRDEAHRESLGLPAEPRHTWGEGLQRLLLGYSLPRSAADIPLFDEILPYDDLEGGLTQTLGGFAEFVETLVEYSARLDLRRTLHDWADELTQMIGRALSPTNEDEEETCQKLRDDLDSLRELAERADCTEKVDLAVIKRWLGVRLRAEAAGSGFLTGGVTFCAMVPMRSLPFKVICLLGLNDEAFPRRQRPPGFDLIARHPRRGDRSRRLDDRYLFLETLLSARQALYISYVGRNIRDNGELPPSVLVADLLDVVKAGFVLEEGADCLPSIVTLHPLQAFNPAYFQGDPKRPGYSHHWLEAAKKLGSSGEDLPPLFASPLPEPEQGPIGLDLMGLAHFFANPARYLLQHRLGLNLKSDEEAFDNREPFALDYFDKEALRRLALEEIRRAQPPRSASRVAQASGILPHGGFGQALFAREQAVAKKAASAILPLLDLPFLEPIPLHFESEGVRLEGFLADCTQHGLVQWRLQPLGPRDYFDLWLRHLALCLLQPPGVALHSRLIGAQGEVSFGPVKDAGQEIAKLLRHYRHGLCRPLPFFVKSAWSYAEAEPNKGREAALKAAHQIWDRPGFRNGNFFGESENPYYQATYRGIDPLDEEFENLALDIISPMRAAMTKPT